MPGRRESGTSGVPRSFTWAVAFHAGEAAMSMSEATYHNNRTHIVGFGS